MQFVLQEQLSLKFCQTYVIQTQSDSQDMKKIQSWARAQMEMKQIGAYASVFLENEYHVLVTFTSAFKKEDRYQKIQTELKKYQVEAKIKISPLTRRLQRKLGLGDAKKDILQHLQDLEKIIEEGSWEKRQEAWDELAIIWPEGKKLMEFPDVTPYMLLNYLTAPAQTSVRECAHEDTISMGLNKNLSLCRNDKTHLPPFYYCKNCKQKYCLKCCQKAIIENEEVRTLDEMRKWIAEQADDIPKFVFTHPTDPLPFYVLDSKKISEEEKLWWIRGELGSEACLTAFAKYFIYIFADCIQDEKKLKQKINELYCTYKNLPKRKLEDIPNQDKGPFHRIWNKKAPDYCDCGAKIKENAQFCQKCRPNPMLDLKRKFEISKPRDDDDDLTKKMRKIQTDMNQVYGIEPIEKRKGHLCKVPFL